MISLIVIVAILVIAYIKYLKDVFSYWKKRGVVGPTPWPVVGNYGPVLFRQKSEIQIMKELYKMYPKEKVIGIFVGHTPALLVKDPTMVRQVLVKDFSSFPDRILSAFVRSTFSKSLFASPGNDNWKNSRKSLTVLSNRKVFNHITNSIEAATNDFFDELDENIIKLPKQNMFKLQEKYFYKVVSYLVLGKSFNAKEGKVSMIQYHARNLEEFETLEVRYCFELVFPSLSKAIEKIVAFVGKFVTRYFFQTILSITCASKESKINDVPPFTGLALELQKETNKKNEWQLDDETVMLHLATTITATTSTTSNAAAFLCYALAENPDIQNKCHAEIEQAFQDCGELQSVEFMSKLKYFEIVLEEVMRRYGVNSVVNRICRSKYRFPDTNITVDPGVIMYVPQEAFRQDPNYYPEPDKFIPERFSPENKDKIPPGVHIPFGYGPRICIGLSIAKSMLKMCMAAFLLRYKLEPSETEGKDLKYSPTYISKKPEKNEMWINITRRN